MNCDNLGGMGHGSTLLLRSVVGAYRKRLLPARGYGPLFDRTPRRLWGGDDVVALTEVGDLKIRLRDPGARQLLVFGRIMHESGETAFVRRVASRLEAFYDVGANYGWYARLVATSSQAAVVAVEANPSLIPYLAANLPSARVVHAAVADAPGRLEFHVSVNSALSSAQRAVGETVHVEAVTMDSLVVDGDVTLVKCDVEGGELAMLRGARALRSRPEPPIWLIEADEAFLRETGSSYVKLDEEFKRFGPVEYYRTGRDGGLIRLNGGLEDLRGTRTVNVVVVPVARLPLVSDFVRTG